MTFEEMHEELESGKAISLSSKKEIAFTKWLGKNNIKRSCYRHFIDDDHIMIIYGKHLSDNIAGINKMSDSHIEAKFEELEDIIRDEFVRDKVSECKNMCTELLECLIYEFKSCVKRHGLNNAKLLTMCRIIEKATGKPVEEVIK